MRIFQTVAPASSTSQTYKYFYKGHHDFLVWLKNIGCWSVTNNIHANQCSKNGCSNTKEAQTIFTRS